METTYYMSSDQKKPPKKGALKRISHTTKHGDKNL